MAAIKEKKCYTVQEIQEILNISRPSVYNLLKKGEFHSVYVAGKHRISKKSFDDWLNGVDVESEGNDIAGNIINENAEHDEQYQLTNEEGKVKSAFSGSSMVNTGMKKEAVKYQEMQEKFLQGLIETYMMINQTGIME